VLARMCVNDNAVGVGLSHINGAAAAVGSSARHIPITGAQWQ
jgi:hypothetical protein